MQSPLAERAFSSPHPRTCVTLFLMTDVAADCETVAASNTTRSGHSWRMDLRGLASGVLGGSSSSSFTQAAAAGAAVVTTVSNEKLETTAAENRILRQKLQSKSQALLILSGELERARREAEDCRLLAEKLQQQRSQVNAAVKERDPFR